MSQLVVNALNGLALAVRKALAWAIRDHIEAIRMRAYRQGSDSGLRVGREEGYATGFADGQLVYRVEDSAPEPKCLDPGLYGPVYFAVAPVEAAMRAKVAQAVEDEIVRPPTPEQWDMILASHPATCISAGAGSGKSTTLVLRVVFMLEYLGVRDEEVTVISFTRKSCDDLRKSLGKVLGYWRQRDVPERWLLDRVRTFHSVLVGLARSSLPGRDFFDNLDVKEKKTAESGSGEDDLDNPVGTSSKLSEPQAVLLREAYISLFAIDRDFREAVAEILIHQVAIAQRKPNDNPDWDVKLSSLLSAREAALNPMVEASWVEEGWPFPGVEAIRTVVPTSFARCDIFANGIETATGIPVILGVSPRLSDDERKVPVGAPGAKPFRFDAAATAKLNFLGRQAEKRFILIDSDESLEAFRVRQRFLRGLGQDIAMQEAPVFNLRLPGELKAAPIYEALYNQGSFIETLGVEVTTLLGRMPSPQVMDVNSRFAVALGRFWPHLRAFLESNRLHTYNQCFLTMTKKADRLALPVRRLEAVRHLLVDEFQDISPQIAEWLKAMQRRLLAENPGKPVSIMAIGDDWQSIYGWRGSAPQLFIKFSDYFPSHEAIGLAPRLLFTGNFRSVRQIVEDAERLIAKVRSKVTKTCVPQVACQAGDHGVRYVAYGQDRKMDEAAELGYLAAAVKEQYAAALEMASKHEDKVIVMTRTGKLANRLARCLPEDAYPGLLIGTYHAAKGLEADIAIMIDDTYTGDSYPLRNQFYAISGLYPNYSYDDASADEALRLAYVGVTRGRRRVIWLVKSPRVDGSSATFDPAAGQGRALPVR